MGKFGDWELLNHLLGSGGQSDVQLVRSPQRSSQRAACIEQIRRSLDGARHGDLATAIWNYARPDDPDELGALKVFRVRGRGSKAFDRLKSEISILRKKKPGLPRLLDANEEELWMVTQYFPGGTLATSPVRYKGDALEGLRAFRTLTQTVASSLHSEKIVHRDIKPANIFIADDGTLIPGDFGIVYLPSEDPRPTVTGERVGPWEYMPQWADLGDRLEDVTPAFDVYMLGKVLWCMISGRLRLPREYHRRPEFDLAVAFPSDPRMGSINSILDRCLVEEPDACFPTANELLRAVDAALATFQLGTPLRDKNGALLLPCRVCGVGSYYDPTPGHFVRLHSLDAQGRVLQEFRAHALICNVCTHWAMFAPNYPEEAATRGWTSWPHPGSPRDS